MAERSLTFGFGIQDCPWAAPTVGATAGRTDSPTEALTADLERQTGAVHILGAVHWVANSRHNRSLGVVQWSGSQRERAT